MADVMNNWMQTQSQQQMQQTQQQDNQNVVGVENAWVNKVQQTPISLVAQTVSENRKAMQKRSDQQVISDLFGSSNSLYGVALNKRNQATTPGEFKASQLDAFAAMVKWRAIEEGYSDEREDYNTTEQIIWHYIDLNNSELVNRKLIDYANGKKDPYEFWIEMGVILTPDEQRMRGYERDIELLFWKNVPNWITGVYWWTQEFLNKIWMPINMLWVWEWNDVTSAQSSRNDEAKIVWAIENYAWKNFGKHIHQLNEYETYKILNDLQNPEQLKEYAPNSTKAFTRLAEWVWGTVMESMFPWVTTSLSLIDEVPVVWDIVSTALSYYTMAIWVPLSVLTPTVWKQLPQDERKEWYSFLGTLFLVWNHSRWGSRWDNAVKNRFNSWLKNKFWWWDWPTGPTGPSGGEWWNLWELALKPEWQMSLWDAFKEWKKSKNDYKMKQKTNQLQSQASKEMYDQAAKIWDISKTYENSKVSNALANIDVEELRNIRSYADLYNTIRDAIKVRWDLQNSILDTFERFIWRENGRLWWGADLEYDVRVENYDYPVEDWIKMMREMNPDWKWRNAMDAVNQWYSKWKLSVGKIKRMVRALNAQSRIFKKWLTGEELKNHNSKVARITQQLNQLVKEWLNNEPAFKELWLDNVMEYLDKQESDLLYTRDLVSNIRNKLAAYEADLPNSNIIKITSKLLSKFRSLRSLISWGLDELAWPDRFNPQYRQSELNNMLNKWADLNETLEKYKTPKEIEEALDKFNKKYQKDFWKADEWAIEWEVIDPEERESWDAYDAGKYLEDIVRVEEAPETTDINNLTQNGWTALWDYTSKYNITPEKWAGELNKWWMDWTQIWELIKSLKKNSFKLKKELKGLFDDLPQDLETEILWEDIANARAKAIEEADAKTSKWDASKKTETETKKETEDLKKDVKKNKKKDK